MGGWWPLTVWLREAAGNIALGSNGFSDTFQLWGIWFKRRLAVLAEAEQMRALRLCSEPRLDVDASHRCVQIDTQRHTHKMCS